MLEKVKEVVRNKCDSASTWIRDNKEIAVAGGIVGAAVIKAVLKRVLAKPTIIYQIELKKED